MSPTTRSKNQQQPKKNNDNAPSTSKKGIKTKQSIKKSLFKTKNTNAGIVPKEEHNSEWKINYLEAEISSKCALRRLRSLQTYASRRGELKLFGLISESLNEVERIIDKCKLVPKQTLMTEFFDAVDHDGDSDSKTD